MNDQSLSVPQGQSLDERQLAERRTAEPSVFDRFNEFFGSGISASNFDGTKFEQLKLAAITTGGKATPGAEYIGKEFTFRYWFIQHVQIENPKTGEITDCPRVVLIGDGGEAIQFVSMGVYQTLRTILQYLGTGSLGEGVTVIPRSKKARVGNVLFLEPVSISE